MADKMTVDQLLDLHERLCERGRSIMRAKNHDYTSGSTDIFANFTSSEMFGVSTVQGMLVRLGDKLKRILSFDQQGVLKVADDKIEDSVVDGINYLVLIAGFIEQSKGLSEKIGGTE